MKKTIILPISLLILSDCSSFNKVQIENKQALYDNCMETFQDETKCNQMMKKSEEDLKTTEQKRAEQREKLTEEGYNGLKIREVMLQKLYKQTKPFVKEYLGEPDSVSLSGDGEVFHYTRPISIYEIGSAPDDEVYVFFRKNFVQKVTIIKPSSERSKGFSWGNWLKNSKKNKNENRGGDELEDK